MTPMKQQDSILIRVWASTCEIWWPQVIWNRTVPRNTYFARRRFEQHGIPWASGKADGAAQQAASRALADVDGRLLTVTKRGGRTCYVRLTEPGEYRAGSMVGIPDLAANLAEMRRLQSFDDHPAGLVGFFEGGIPEKLLLGWTSKEPAPQEFLAGVSELTLRLTLALVRGWVESNSTGDNQVFYRLSDSGRAILDKPPACHKRLPKPTIEALDLFTEVIAATRNEIATATNWGPAGELGGCPISCSPTTRGMLEARQS